MIALSRLTPSNSGDTPSLHLRPMTDADWDTLLRWNLSACTIEENPT